MKKILFAIAFATTAFIQTKAVSLGVLTAESGNRAVEQANCWAFGAVSYTSTPAQLITGSWSMRSNSPTSLLPSACWVKSPWIKVAAGNVTMKIKFEASTAATIRRVIVSYIPYDANNLPYKEGALVRFDSISYSVPLPTTSQSLSFPIPSSIVSNSAVYKIQISFVGTGGTTRFNMDDISIPAEYWSDPSNSCLPLALIVDADSDGVADADDAYPNDATRAYNNYYPAAGFGTLMFEDLWPATGDYDFNDLVVDYRYNLVTNASNKVVEMKSKFVTRAIGASLHNGFAFQINGLAPAKITATTGAKYHAASWLDNAANGTENGQTSANIIVFDDAQKVLPSSGGSGTNTIPANPRVAPDTTSLDITFTNVSGQMIGLSDVVFNPYIIVDQTRGKEVHLPDFVPSTKANTALFGTGNDDTKPGSNKYYKTANNLPWALNVTTSIPYMIEKEDFLTGYLKFADWAQSNGGSYTDWYINNPGYRNAAKLFVP
ncbi:MAG: hypothetical protein CFE21_02775 [Bacteroidetes bacterium B1(2017)]|nr:MAG: hypothetical protein CFE21_02775 [Bacteroidetes bacterium B1(2017)]